MLVAAIAVLSCLLTYSLGRRVFDKEQTAPGAKQLVRIDGLAVAVSSLDLGECWEEKAVPCQLPIRNLTGNPIEVYDFAASCTCLEVAPRSITVPAHETVTISVKVDLSRRTSIDLGRAVRPFTIEVIPIFKGGKQPRQGWALHGSVRSRITLSTTTLDFGESPVQGEPSPVQKVVAKAHVPSRGLEARTSSRSVTCQVSRVGTTPDTFEVAIAPQSTLPPGSFSANVIIDLITPSGERLPGVTLPVLGQVQPEVRPLPARLLLGSRPVGETVNGVVVLQAPVGAEVAVEQIETDSADVNVEPVAIDGSPAGRTFRVTQRVVKEGDQASTVCFRIRKSGGRPQSVQMEVCYRGEAAGKR